ncbi:unnamed protein product [Spodoptera littoralis]|uniref:Uncharacterized protein n=1 Tax=Spodoptera littoralis TaxID=7109 RepID=A0A9P0IGH5_SPOLI|nr:unnamed protein product [Spodoptera littoralis]CAH1645751.1 unnamed protein product [Spodoptera littoralis]
MVAILRTIMPNGESVELAKCKGKGEIYWPFIRLDPQTQKKTSSGYMSTRELNVTSARSMFKGGKAHKSNAYKSSRSLPKIKPVHEAKFYSIEVTCPSGWALSLAQWKRVDEVINSMEFNKVEHLQIQKKVVKEKEKEKPPKTASGKDKEKLSMPVNFAVHQPLPGDACVELECALAVGGGVVAKRDDERDQEFANARKSWDATEHGRNARGAQIRKEFREEFLDMPPPPEVSESSKSGSTFRSYNMDTDRSEGVSKDGYEGLEEEELKDFKDGIHGHEPTPATESGMLEMSVEIEEEAVYLTMPEQLRDKFKPLHFLPFCMKEKLSYEAVLVTSDMAKAAAKDRQARTEAALERMKELQLYNEAHVLGRQKDRCNALEKLFVDATMCPELLEVMEQREDAMKEEVLARTASANKKKMEAKKMEIKKTEVKKTEGKRKQ